MPDFKYLGKQGFPHADNVDVYRYSNQMDYKRYDFDQMKITVCSVPWDMGEAHIGNRTIDGVGNVVYFESAAKRDEWFASIPDADCFRWETKYKDLHSDMTITVPLPFDIAAKYNYVFVEYAMYANDDSPVQYEDASGVRKWCYFIRHIAANNAPNAVTLELMDDVWQTFIYGFNVTGMILERGHAPMFKTSVEAYLSNPMDNCENLLAEDVNFGDLQRVTKTQATLLNGNVRACIATTANVRDSWVDKCPAPYYNEVSGVPAMCVVSCVPSALDLILSNMERNFPWFKQTVQAIFFVNAEYLSLGDTFSFGGADCRMVLSTNSVSKTILARSASDWSYDAKYKNIAKLYTWPYSAYEVTDEKGDASIVKIEDTTGTLTMDMTANLVFPYLNLSGTINGIGSKTSTSITFSNITERSFSFCGRWYEHLKKWEIPTFAVMLDASTKYGYATKYDRAQMDNDRYYARQIAERDADTGYDVKAKYAEKNYDSAETQKSADLTKAQKQSSTQASNAQAQILANTSSNSAGNVAATEDCDWQNQLAQALQAWDSGLTRDTVNIESDAAIQSAAISAASSVAGGAVAGAASGGIAGAIGGLISGGIDAATTGLTTAVSINAETSKAEAMIANSQDKTTATANNNSGRTTVANVARNKQRQATNTAISTVSANTSEMIISNASTQFNATGTINSNTKSAAIYDAYQTQQAQRLDATDAYDNAGLAIDNLVKQAALDAPSVYGSIASADFATTRPQALFVNILTQSKSAIKQAGDEFLRYGYRLDQQWDFDGNWNVGKHFTYWKLRDYWVKSNTMQDYYQDAIRFFLMGGVTIWRKPEEIGAVSIYDNFND